jgi:hypothetical protein
MDDALVQGDDHDVRLRLRRRDILRQNLTRLIGDMVQGGSRRDRSPVSGRDRQIGRAGAVRRRPGCLWPDAIIAEQRHASSAHVSEGGLARGGDVRASAGKGDAGLAERPDRVGDTPRAAIAHMVAREAHHMDPRRTDRGDILRRRTRRRHVTALFCDTAGVRNFEMGDREIGRLQRRRNPREPVGAVRLVEDEVARQHDRNRPSRHRIDARQVRISRAC